MFLYPAWACEAISALSASTLSVQYMFRLPIRGPSEAWRFVKKSINFGLCYAGLAPVRQFYQARMAGRAAFLCSAYDVVTDWRGFDPAAWQTFLGILSTNGGDSATQNLAIKLYRKELVGSLRDDGLERGAIALRFALRLMASEEECDREWSGLDEIGYKLQIIDDVLDLEEDIRNGDTNCLLSARCQLYLTTCAGMDDKQLREIFGPNRSVLKWVIRIARTKAKNLQEDPAMLKQAISVSVSET